MVRRGAALLLTITLFASLNTVALVSAETTGELQGSVLVGDLPADVQGTMALASVADFDGGGGWAVIAHEDGEPEPFYYLGLNGEAAELIGVARPEPSAHPSGTSVTPLDASQLLAAQQRTSDAPVQTSATVADAGEIEVITVADTAGFDPRGGLAVAQPQGPDPVLFHYSGIEQSSLSGIEAPDRTALAGTTLVAAVDATKAFPLVIDPPAVTAPDVDPPPITIDPAPVGPVTVEPTDPGPVVTEEIDPGPVAADPSPVIVPGVDPGPISEDPPPIYVAGPDLEAVVADPPPVYLDPPNPGPVSEDPPPIYVSGPDLGPVVADPPPIYVDPIDPGPISQDPPPIYVSGPDLGPVVADPPPIYVAGPDPDPIVEDPPPIYVAGPDLGPVVADPPGTGPIYISGPDPGEVCIPMEDLTATLQALLDDVDVPDVVALIQALLDDPPPIVIEDDLVDTIRGVIARLLERSSTDEAQTSPLSAQEAMAYLSMLTALDGSVGVTSTSAEAPCLSFSSMPGVTVPGTDPDAVVVDPPPVADVSHDADPISVNPPPLPTIDQDPSAVVVDPPDLPDVERDPDPISVDPPDLPTIDQDPAEVVFDPQPLPGVTQDPAEVTLDLGPLPGATLDPAAVVVDPTPVGGVVIDPPKLCYGGPDPMQPTCYVPAIDAPPVTVDLPGTCTLATNAGASCTINPSPVATVNPSSPPPLPGGLPVGPPPLPNLGRVTPLGQVLVLNANTLQFGKDIELPVCEDLVPPDKDDPMFDQLKEEYRLAKYCDRSGRRVRFAKRVAALAGKDSDDGMAYVPDILTLQETDERVDKGSQRADANDIARQLESALGYPYRVGIHSADELDTPGGDLQGDSTIIYNAATMAPLDAGGTIDNPDAVEKDKRQVMMGFRELLPASTAASTGTPALEGTNAEAEAVEVAVASIHFDPGENLGSEKAPEAKARWANEVIVALREAYPGAAIQVIAGDFNESRCAGAPAPSLATSMWADVGADSSNQAYQERQICQETLDLEARAADEISGSDDSLSGHTPMWDTFLQNGFLDTVYTANAESQETLDHQYKDGDRDPPRTIRIDHIFVSGATTPLAASYDLTCGEGHASATRGSRNCTWLQNNERYSDHRIVWSLLGANAAETGP